MPTYQYVCTVCDEQLEVVQKFSDDPLAECTDCGGRLRKMFSPVGVVFKGSGFYRTDSRNGSANGKATSSQNGSANDSSSEAGKSGAEKSGAGESTSSSGEAKSGKTDTAGSKASSAASTKVA